MIYESSSMWLIKLLSYQYGHLLRAFELTYHTIGFTIGRQEVPQTTQDSWLLVDCRLLLSGRLLCGHIVTCVHSFVVSYAVKYINIKTVSFHVISWYICFLSGWFGAEIKCTVHVHTFIPSDWTFKIWAFQSFYWFIGTLNIFF